MVRNLGVKAKEFTDEFRNHLTIALSSAFGLLIALSWQATIKQYIDSLVEKISFPQDPFFYNLYASIFVTIVGVIAIMIISKWRAKVQQNP